MKVSCKYCGGFHPRGYECPKKPKRKNAQTAAFKFRSTGAWQRKREEIKQRDRYLCQICIRGLYIDGGPKLTYRETHVHHIIPIAEDWDRRLDAGNLLTVCAYHHEMAEAGEIPRAELLKTAQEQEGTSPGACENLNAKSVNTNSGPLFMIKSQNESR